MKRYKHVLAINPYFGDSTAAMGIFPNTGLEYIVASMKDLAEKLTYLDLRYETAYQDPEVLSQFIRAEVDLVCVSIRWTARFHQVCELVSKLPPEVTTIIGGHKATEEVETLFETLPNVDMIVRGEGEMIIREILQGKPKEEVLGLSYRKDDHWVHNDNQELPDVAEIPFPDRSLRQHDYRWFQHGIKLSHHTFDTVLSTRGCPFKCKFCTFNINPLGQKRSYTERPVESVIEELKTITADFVLFSDDNFFTNPERGEKLCDLIIENNLQKIYAVQARIDIAQHPKILAKAEKAGFRLFLLGVESPHDRILKHLQKGITQARIRESFKVLTQYNFFLHGYFIYGNITETEEEMLYIAKFAREIQLDSISFQKLRVEKFSPLEEIVNETPGYYFERIGGPVYSEQYGGKELKKIRNRIRSGFYTPRQLLHIARKAKRIGLVENRDLVMALKHSPRLTYAAIQRKIRKWKKYR